MRSLRTRLGIPRYGPNGSTPWQIFSSKAVRATLALLVLSGILLTFLRFGTSIHGPHLQGAHDIANTVGAGAKNVKASHEGRLHLLIPATSSNADLCKLLLSAQILGYPTPILLNFGDIEDHEDAYVQHLAKVQGIYDYLQKIALSSVSGEDLVLIIDGYDLWFQLRPDVLIKRYYAINKEADERAMRDYGHANMTGMDMKHTVLFGPDKICWPIDYNRPACWAVPESNMPYFAFGPQTNNGREELNHPIWLNSGTIMGPVQDLLEVFSATLKDIENNYVTNSDQFYFAEIFGMQEFARLQNNQDLMDRRKRVRYGEEVAASGPDPSRAAPEIKAGQKTEFHIGIDYASSLFQTLAYWKQYLTWFREVDAWSPGNGPSALYHPGLARSPYDLKLPEDVHESAPPFSATRGRTAQGESVAHPSWAEVRLLYNAVSRQAPVVIHYTGEKQYRQYWWQRMWFQSRAEELRKKNLPYAPEPISPREIEGRMWYNAEIDETDDLANHGKGGAFDDRGGYLGWRRLCATHEEEIYTVPGEDFFHPPPEADQ